MNRRTVSPAWIAAAAVAAAALLILPFSTPIAVRAGAMLLMFAFVPGWLLAGVVAPRESLHHRLLIAVTTAPFLTGGLGSAFMIAGADAGTAGRVVATIVAGAAIPGVLRGPGTRKSDGGALLDGGGASLEPVIVSGAWAAGIAILLVANPVLQVRTDGWFHAAVTEQIARRGLPPEDPFFAGLRLLYFWGAHAWSALWLGLAPGMRSFTPLVVMNLAGAMAVILGLWSLAERLGASRVAARWAVYLGLFAYAPCAWGWIALRAARGAVKGWPEVERIAHSGVGPALQAMSPGLMHLSMVFFPGKHLVLTSFGLGLGLFLAFAVCVHDLPGRTGTRDLVRLSLVLAAALFVHTVVGLACLLLLGIWGLFEGLRRLVRRETLVPVLRVAFAAVVAVAAVSPYLASILMGKEGQMRSGLSPLALSTWIWGGLLVVPAGTLGLRRRSWSLFVVAAALTLLGLAIDPSDNNQSKFMNLLFLLLAAPAAMELHKRLRGPVGAAVLLTTLPTVVFSFWVYGADRGTTLEPWARPNPDRAAAYSWAREHLPDDAILIEPDGGRGAPVFAGVSVLWGGDEWAKKWGYPPEELAGRRRAAMEMIGGETSGLSDVFLARLGREVVVLRDSVEFPALPGATLYANSSVVLERAFPPRVSVRGTNP